MGHQRLISFQSTATVILLLVSILSAAAGHSTGSDLLKCGGDTEEEGGGLRLSLGLHNLEVSCAVSSGSGALTRQNKMEIFSSVGLPPILTIYNSISSRNFSFMLSADRSTWRVNVSRRDVTGRTDPAPLHQWYVEVSMPSGGGGVPRPVRGTLLDVVREPVLQWTMGEEMSAASLTSLLSRVTGLKIAQSPCAGDVAVVAPVFGPGEHPGVVLGVTRSAFASRTRWFNATGSLCSLVERPSGCRGISAVDVKLTNRHLFLLTSSGLFVSRDLLRPAAAPLDFTLLPLPAPARMNFSSCGLWSSSLCLADPNYYDDDIVSLTSSLSSHCVYSRFPFRRWHSCRAATDQRCLSFLYDRQQQTGLLLTHSDGQAATVSVIGMEGEVLRNRTRFPPVTVHFRPRGLLLLDNQVVLYGSQVWLSESRGATFHPVFSLEEGESVVDVLSCRLSRVLVFLTDRGRLYLMKPDLNWRFVHLRMPAPARSTLLCDHMGVLTALSVEPNAPSGFGRSAIDAERLIQEHESGFDRPLALQFISPTTVLLHEHTHVPPDTPGHTPAERTPAEHTPAEHTPAEHTPQRGSLFSPADVGKLIFLRDGGQVSITEVSQEHQQPGFTGHVKGDIFQLIKASSQETAPQQGCSVLVKKKKKKKKKEEREGLNVELRLQGLDTCPSFGSSHIGKTVVVPGYSSYLIIRVSPGGVAVADPTTPASIPPSGLHAAGTWLLFDSAGSAGWGMREGPCRHALQSLDGLRRGSLVRIPVGEQLNFTFRAVMADSSRPVVLRKKLIVVISGPSAIRLNADHRWDAANNNLVTLRAASPLSTKTMTTVSLSIPESSLLCTSSSFAFTLQNWCPKGLAVVYLPSRPITKRDWLRGYPIDGRGRPSLIDLPANYRPPSGLEDPIPISDNVYNADPGRPLPPGRRAGRYKRCSGKRSAERCRCTDAMRLSPLAADSDCRRRVPRLTTPALTLRLFLRTPGRPDRPLRSPYSVDVVEVNGRDDWKVAGRGPAREALDPDGLRLHLLGSQLFHFRVEVVFGVAFCPLEEEVQVYVDPGTHHPDTHHPDTHHPWWMIAITLAILILLRYLPDCGVLVNKLWR
ncbi:cation channel sperm-associated auxiliary subunit beta-like [Centroberyx affinis]|uniref:cation channel sperm-associated auxiliary subunit beta-like n=1 Tax=Centroberyx affinis TaxID=166261 RepID=UPI003A5BDE98